MRKIICAIVALMILILIVGAYASGVWFQKNYLDFISSLNSSNIFHATLLEYKRGWMSSDITLELEMNKNVISRMTDDDSVLINIPNIILKQHVQQGPLFFHLTVSGLNVSGTVEQNQMGIQKIKSDVWIFILQKRIKGVIDLTQAWIKNEDDYLAIPYIQIKLDQYSNKQNVWLGSGSLTMPDILLKEGDEKAIRITDLKVEGSTDSDDVFVNADRKIKIKSVQYENQLIGPIDLKISFHKLYLPAIQDLIETYRNYFEKGEIYQGQLRQKIERVLPQLVTAGTFIALDDFHMNASSGRIAVNGDFKWPENKFLPPENVRELVLLGNGEAKIRISEKLMSDLIYLASTLPDFIRDVAEPQKPLLMDKQSQMEFAMQENFLFIDFLAERGYINRQTADILISAQKEWIPMDEYAKLVRDLLLDRQITLVVSYQLCGQYAQIMKSYHFLKESVEKYRTIAEKQIGDIFKSLVKKGYVSEDRNDYSTTLKWTENAFTSNGLPVK